MAMDARVRNEANGEPRVLRPLERVIDAPISREDSLLYARACLPAAIDVGEVPRYAAFVRHVLADVRDLP